MNYAQAKKLRAMLEEFAKSLTDEEALDGAEVLFPKWAVGVSYNVGDRVYYDGVLYKVLQAHTSLETWTPDVVPALFAKVLIQRDDEGEQVTIPEWEQPSATNPYMKGDKVRFGGYIYVSLIDYNVWAPNTPAAGLWELVEE